MSTDFGQSYISLIDGAIQQGRGAAATVVGQMYDVYRLTTQSGQVVSGTALYKNFPAKLTRWKNTKDIENEDLGAIVFAATCNNLYLQIGDILVGLGSQGYRSDGAMYVVADERPLKQTVVVRCEQSATITRPTTSTSNVSLNVGKPTVVTTYSGITKSTETSLVLNNGQYSWSTSGTAAMVPFGLQPTHRLREYPASKLPTDTRKETFIGFLPATPGVIIEENDVISSGSAGDRYRVEQNYIAEHGLQGQILIVEKLVV